jgi:hypothetical protein
MTFLGGIGHSLPFLLSTVELALTVAYFVFGLELIAIASIRHRFFGMSFPRSIFQVVVGGGLVFAAGVTIGGS